MIKIQVRFMDIMKDHQLVNIPLLFGVATSNKYQKCGYMRQLLEYIFSVYSYDFMLVQAYNWDVYRTFGFNEAYTIQCHNYVSEGVFPQQKHFS